MLYWAIGFLAGSIVAWIGAVVLGTLGFDGFAFATATVSKLLFFVSLVLLVISLIAAAFRRRRAV